MSQDEAVVPEISEDAGRAAVVAEALSWLATPYAHRQRVKGLGVDCAQFPLAVYLACGVVPPETDPGPYPTQWHLHRSEELYVAQVLRLAREIAPHAVQPGDLMLWRYGRTFSHGALALTRPRVIHAVRGAGVTLDDMTVNEELRTRAVRAFSVWGTSAP